MSILPKIAIVGRPNVGKSALFNRISGKRIAIVDPAEGVTRDRLIADAEVFGKKFLVIDTGGIDEHSDALFNDEIKEQALLGISEADALIFVVDGQVGPTDLDFQVLDILRRSSKPFYLAINKVDTGSQQALGYDFHRMGLENFFCISAQHGRGVPELLEAALESVDTIQEEERDASIKVAIVGRPNVGKSTLVNCWLNEHRLVVSPIAGTTRDSIDSHLEHSDTEFTLIDTAGIRKTRVNKEAVEKYAAIRTQAAIERADVCVLVIDAQVGLTAFEKRIARTIEEAGKGCVLFFNKWDLLEGVRMEHCERDLRISVPFLQHCPTIFGSAKIGRNSDKILEKVREVYEAGRIRLPTGQLNAFVEKTLQTLTPPVIQGKRLRIYYLTQVRCAPPRFLFFINHKRLLAESYKRYLHNQFRKAFGFRGNPIVFEIKSKISKR